MKVRYILLIVFVFAAVLLAWRQFRPVYTPPIKDDHGNTLAASVSRLEHVQIGGMRQWIQIRGEDASNPVLLWLHGGPGSAQMPIARHYNSDLEKDFIVVHWDQRGAGKSNPPGFDAGTMTFGQYKRDAYELTQYLKRELNKDRIYLLGHSWGTKIGLALCGEHPEDFYAYIGVSQLVDGRKAQRIAYEWLTGRIDADDSRTLDKLRRLGEPPYAGHEEFVGFIHLVDSFGGGMDAGMAELAMAALPSPEYRLSDFARWLDGANRGSGPMWEADSDWNAFTEAPQIDIPVYFFSGRNDYNTPLELVDAYYEKLAAPEGKTLVVFEDSSHAPFLKEPEKFYEAMKAVKDETCPIP